ncbi:MAG: hypothetical protein CSA62_11960 [Planctomycetota bacterium]|nr:MAG: hypothetical protein CSA62_11960 [Planctomycetota bacterium]
MKRLSLMTCAAWLTCLAASAFAQERRTVLYNATVFTGKGAPIENGWVAFQNGRITELGKGAFEKKGVKAIDLKGAWITPGLIDANTSLGLPSPHENEQSDEVTPQIRVLDAIDPESDDFRKALRHGVTSAYVAPGGFNVFGGIGAVIKTAGPSLGDRIVKAESGLRVTMGALPSAGNGPPRFGMPTSIYNRRPTTRMAVVWEVRNAFYKAMQSRDSGKPVKLRDDKLAVLRKVLDKKLLLRMTARQEHDIRSALRLAEEFGIDIVLDGASEAYYVLDYLIAAKTPVVLTPPSLQRDPIDRSRVQLDTAALLAKKGVPLALQTGQGLASLALVHEAAFAVRQGLPRQAALEAITSVPARILGIQDRVGTLAKGRDADIVVWSEHPLRRTTQLRHVFIDGQERQLR